MSVSSLNESDLENICMGLSVVISYYKAQENLKLILEALKEQSCLDFEVIVS